MNKKWVLLCFVLFEQQAFGIIIKGNENIFWRSYKKNFSITIDEQEDLRRRDIFFKNLKFINDFNSKNNDLKLGESHEMPKGRKIVSKKKENVKSTSNKLSILESIDWRTFEVVSPVEDQGQCGSSYAFSAVGAIESAYAIVYGHLNILSKQQIVDCSMHLGIDGCHGNTVEDAYHYALIDGLVKQDEYKYTGIEQQCQITSQNTTSGIFLLGYNNILQYSETDLLRALSFTGPVSIIIDSNHDEFRFYQSGILKIEGCSSLDLDHSVLAVGYSYGDNPYLLVKNSWGTSWGDNGYFKIALKENNMCGIATSASYPIVV